jgi:HEAT repeat protein
MHHSHWPDEIAHHIAILTAERVDWVERKRAAKRLEELGEPAVLPLLQVLAHGTAGWGTELLIETLGRLGNPRAVEPLLAVLKWESPHARQEAAKALARIGDQRAIGPLIDAFRVESGDTEDITAWQDAAEALAQFGAPALGPLVAALLDDNGNVRAWSADALGQLGDPQAVAPLIAVLSDTALQVRIDATVALGKIGDPAATDAVVARLVDPGEDEHVRTCAARALGHLIAGEVFSPLVNALDDPSIDVRCQALYALAESAGARAVDLLLARVTDPNSCVRHASVHALARVGDESLIPLLERIEQQDQGRCRAVWVKDAARYAIECIGKRHTM